MITKEQISNLAKRWKIDHFSILREYIQILFLFHLYNIKNSDQIYFKGGTAIRLLFDSFRFSEDLDFSTALSAKSISGLLENTLTNFKKELGNISLISPTLKKNSIISRINFKSEETAYPLSIHLEFSLREKPIMPKTSQFETLYPISPYPVVKHLAWEEILAEKIRACFIRAKSRDLFDIWYLLTKEVPLKWDMVNKKMAYYNRAVSPQELVDHIEKINQSDFVKDLAKFLPSTQRPLLNELKPKLLTKLKSSL